MLRIWSSRVAALLAALFVLVAVQPAAAAERVLVDESFSGGSLPQDWTPVLGTWQVVDGRLQATTGGARARIAFGPEVAPENFRVEATVRFVQVSDSARWLNIGADYHVADDYGAVVVARSRTTASNGLELAQAAQGGGYASSPVGPAPVDLGTGQDHRLTVDVTGTHIVVSVDGTPALTADNLRRTGGGFGFVINNSTVQFDDVKIVETDAPNEHTLVDERFGGGVLPQGWTSVLGNWQVVDGRLQATTGDPRARIAFGPDVAPQNFRLEATVRFVQVANSSRWLNLGADYHVAQDWGAVIVARSQTTASNGLELAQAAQGGGYVSSPIGPAPVNIGTGQDHRLTVEAHGTHMVVSVDGVPALTADNFRRTGGGFGFVINNSTVQFDDVKVVELEPQATPPSAPQNVRIHEVGDAANITWEAPAQAGTDADGTPATVSGYEVSIASASAAESSVSWVPATGLSHTFTSLPADAEQVIRVRAVTATDVRGASASVRPLRGATTVGGFKLSVSGGAWPSGHVQGIAVDERKGFIYYSFTNLLVKTDLAGNVVGTVDGFTGHLGDLDFNEADGRVYGSLEYKAAQAFYIAIFDVDRIDRVGIHAQSSPIVSAVYLPEVVEDFVADIDGNGVFDGDTGNTRDHRYGCSGIDGVAFGPAFGSTGGRQYLTVAYGIYSNTSRTDNDHQVLLQYDPADWARYEHPLVESAPHRDGPAEPDGKYFVFTGNTNFGVQNLEYDPWLQRWLLGVYTGAKPQYPNYGMFAVDATAQPVLSALRGLGDERGLLLPLADDGLRDAATGIRGWRQKADVGIQSLGHGLFYLSTDGVAGGNQTSTLTLSYWTGDPNRAFAPVTPDYRLRSQPVRGTVGGSVPATLSLTLGAAASFGTFTPGVARDYTAATSANVISTAGAAALTVSPGRLTNGAFTLASPLEVVFSKSAWDAPVSNDPVTVTFSQHIGASEPLRTGSYSKTLTFTLSTTVP